jgi:hypothetical protein
MKSIKNISERVISNPIKSGIASIYYWINGIPKITESVINKNNMILKHWKKILVYQYILP